MQDFKNTFWNGLAALVNASESVIIIMLASRINGLLVAGMITIGFSLANLFMTIGKFGLRNYQIVHEGYDVSHRTFFKARIITVLLMALTILGYTGSNYCVGNYSLEKSVIIIGVCWWYLVEAFEDYFIASFQRQGRLDLGNIVFIVRWLAIFISFILTDVITRNLVVAIVISDVAALLAEIIMLLVVKCKYHPIKCKTEISTVGLLKNTWSLFLASFASFYVMNISKYAIDRYMDDRTQAIYGYIAMPAFAIALINGIIYQPQLNYYIDDLKENNYVSIKGRIKRQVVIICTILVITVLGGYTVGINILSLLYGVDLSQYKTYMMIILIGSAFLAVGGYLSTVIIIMDNQKINMIIYLIILVIGGLVTNRLVKQFHLLGAVEGYCITMFMLMTGFWIAVHKKLKECLGEF